MTHIQQLSIQGIRSFSPNEPQEIRFLPLTIIIGPNGAGKTSIIESLKYVTTGIMPPNSNSGKTFIHDIQFVDKPIIRGQIRLSFIDTENKLTTITRSMQASIKYQKNKAQVTFRQMNAVIKREDKSIDQKLADINSELLELLGVSKSVLNNVIFCHQEDTYWPLSEGKILKEKFDDIFGSIAFSKALEKIKKYRDEEMNSYKLLEKDVILTQQIKKEADKRRKLLSEENIKIEAEKKKIRQFQIRIGELDSKTNELMEKEQYAEMILNKISQLEGSTKEKKKHAEDILKNCQELLTLNKEEIDDKVTNFHRNVLKLESEKTILESKIKETNIQYENLFQEKSHFSSRIAKMNECENQIKKYFTELDDLVLNLPLPTETKCVYKEIDRNDLDSIDNFRNTIHSFLQKGIISIENRLKEKKDEFLNLESQMNQDLDQMKMNKNQIIHEIMMKQSEIKNLQQQLEQIQSQLNEVCSESYLKTMVQKILDLKCELSKYEERDEDDYKKNIERLEEEKKTLKNECDLLNQQISLANKDSQKRITIDYLKAQKIEKISKIDAIKLNNFEIFMEVGAGSNDDDFSQKLSMMINEKTVELDKINCHITNNEKQCSTLMAKLETKKELLFKKQNELHRIKTKFDGICNVNEFEDFLQMTERKLIRLRDDKSSSENISPIMEKFITTIDQYQSCPICEHDLSSEWISKSSGQTLKTDKLKEKLRKSKNENLNKLSGIMQKIYETENLYNRLMILKSEITTIDCIQADISQYIHEIKMIEEAIQDLKSLLKNDNAKMYSIKEKIDCLRKSMQEAIDYDNSCKDLKEVTQKLEQICCNHDDNGMNLEELNHKRQQNELDLKSCDLKLSNIQKEFIKVTSEKMKLQNLLQAAERNKVEQEKREQNHLLNIQKKDELTLELEQKQNQLALMDKKSGQFDPKIQVLKTKLQSAKEVYDNFVEESQQTIHSFRDSIRTLDRIIKEIQHYLKEFLCSQSKISKDYLDELENNLKRLENNKKQFSDNLNNITQVIANLELNKRKLIDYQTLLNLRLEITKQEEMLKEYGEKMGFMDISSVRKLRIEAERERQDIITQKELSKSRIFELDQKINELNTELNQEEYRNAHEKHKQKSIDKVISELACADLEKYYKALDYAITTFHKNKMEAINKLIDQFWKVSYQGRDIESIQIMADEEERSASDRRRSYNYRVVMIKQGKVLDMRGRCSSGQKVLACLIIRMALAMIFSNNFTVITLDEPTTNLDSANIRTFARAIMTLRKINQNLQIVIITHDEDFLKCISDDSVQKYYKVYKDQNGYSTIALKSIHNETE